uniref:Uncharacterized protein n=1 Tax=Panagrolaimus davidi TaxID=227884 RepID=A0A914PIN6_9BILA
MNDAIEKVRFVFEKQHFSVFVYFENGNIDSNEKTPIYIAFNEKRPIIGKAAFEVYSKKPQFVVFDLIKLCSISNSDIINPKWGFKLENDENESIMVEFETLEGPRRSKVEFLLALILKKGLENISKNGIGKDVEKIEIGFNGIELNEILENNFINAGKLLKTDIVFV